MKLACSALLLFGFFFECLPVSAGEDRYRAAATGNLLLEVDLDVANAEETAALDSFVLKEIDVEGNTILESEIEQAIEPYRGKQIDFGDLSQLESAITEVYVSRGYPNSGAYLPPQKINDGVVKLYVIEGTIGEINISGLDGLSQGYIKSRLGGLDAPLEASRLLDKLYVLRQDPAIESVSATLAAGIEPGTSVLNVDVRESRLWAFSISNNNYKSPSIGSNARILELGHQNLLGFGDRAGVTYTNTEGSNALNLGYAVPYSSTGRISAGYGFASNDIVEEAFNALDIETESNYWQLGVSDLLVNRSNRRVGMGLEFTRQHSETSLLDSPFALSRGADEDGVTNVSALRFSTDYLGRGEESVLSLRSVFSLGLDVFDATVSDDELPDGQFLSWRGQSQYVRNLADDFPLLLRGDIQLAAGELVSLEQFRVGGADSVRGYRQDLLLGDSGIFAGAELRIPLYKSVRYDGLLQLAPFVDFGTVWNSGDLELDSTTAVSLGVGLNLNAFGDRFNGRVDFGIPLIDKEADDRPVSFLVDYNF